MDRILVGKEGERGSQKDVYTPMFIAALFTTSDVEATQVNECMKCGVCLLWTTLQP